MFEWLKNRGKNSSKKKQIDLHRHEAHSVERPPNTFWIQIANKWALQKKKLHASSVLNSPPMA